MLKPNTTEVKNTQEARKFPANKKITALLETLQITERLNPLQKAQPFLGLKNTSERLIHHGWFPGNFLKTLNEV